MEVTPFKVFLMLSFILLICFLFDNGEGTKGDRSIATIGGISILAIIVDVIWGIFYYINI